MPVDFNLVAILPELVLAIGAMVLLMVGVFGGERSTAVVNSLALVLLVGAGVAVIAVPDRFVAFNGAFTFDAFAQLLKVLTLIGSGVTIILTVGHARAEKYDRFEYPLLIVIATLGIGNVILTEAALSFLGLGVQPPTASWGSMVNDGREAMITAWWISTYPGLAIVLTVVAFNLLGDGLRDALDPRLRT